MSSYILCAHRQVLRELSNEKEGADGKCGVCGREENFVQINGVNLKEIGSFEGLSVD